MRYLASLLAVLLSCSSVHAQAAVPVLQVITFRGDVSQETAVALDQAFQVASGASAILLVIDSHGGDADAMLVMVRTVQEAPMPVHCLVQGEADSAAFVLLQACTTRAMTPDSKLMAHDPAFRFSSDPGPLGAIRLRSMLSDLAALSEQMAAICAPPMGLTVAEFQTLLSGSDVWMGPATALRLKAVDRVVGLPVLRQELSK